MSEKFIGRKEELMLLERLTLKKSASLVVLRGRRRIGKSRLAEEFGKKYKFIKFSGLPPEKGMNANDQKENFANLCVQQLGTAKPDASDWSNLFLHLARETTAGRIVILFDEISWMAEGDPTFLSKLKQYWDNNFKQNPKLILLLCGSVSSWIEENLINSTGFVGRISLTLTLKEIPLSEAVEFWGSRASRTNPMEIFKIFSITGGVPRYLEEIIYSEPAEENIKRLCFTPEGLLLREFNQIFYDAFKNKSKFYREIIAILVSGSKDTTHISNELDIPVNGRLTEILNELVLAGFVQRDYTWNIKSGQESKLSQYRLSDNYLRFYCHYIKPNEHKIEKGDFTYKSLNSLDNWQTIMGLQFENLVLNNRQFVIQECGIDPHDIITHNPFFQRKTQLYDGCQIDYMIQTRFNTIYVCEIKFSQSRIGCEVIKTIEQKMKRIAGAEKYSIRPILIHVGGVTQDLQEIDFFDKIIDFKDILLRA